MTTDINLNGTDWRLSTSKRSGGNLVSDAQKGHKNDGSFSFMMFSDENIKLISEKCRATEKTIREQHEAAILKFHSMAESGEIKTERPETIQEGQIIFLNGYGQDEHHHEREAVYKIVNGGFGLDYHCVNLETLAFSIQTHVRPISEKFGIGTYFTPGDVINIEEMAGYVSRATEKLEADGIAATELKAQRQKERNLKIETGRELVNIPAGATHIIRAEKHERDHDPYADYIDSTVSEVVYLAFAFHGRDLFPEMRKACLNTEIEDIRLLHDADESAEHREKYSMGGGYYLGTGYKSGWQVSKTRVDVQNIIVLENLYIAAAEGRYFCNNSSPEDQAVNIEPIEVKPGQIQVIEYGDKALAVIGDTRPIKDKLKELGGRFNFRLTCGPGWIFPKTKLSELQAALSS